MAGDWIKMRVNLVTHPKVLAISERLAGHSGYQDWSTMGGFAPSIGGTQEEFDRDFSDSLRVTRYVTVCALLRFWGYANEHARNEFIATLRVNDIDDIVQVPGFGCALESVGWIKYDHDRQGLSLPNFNEFNKSGHERTAGAKTAAQRQKEYRDRKRAANSDVTSDVTGDVTRHRREEKRREEKKEEKDTPPASADGSRKGDKRGVEIDTWLTAVGDGEAIPADDPIFDYAEKAGIPRDYLELSWLRFCEDMRERKTRKKDWRAHYRNAVRNNWYKLWWFPDGGCALTTAGEQARRAAA